MSRWYSRVSANVNHGGIKTNRLWLWDLHTEFALDPGLVSDCLHGGLDTTSTQLWCSSEAVRRRTPFAFGSDGMRSTRDRTPSRCNLLMGLQEALVDCFPEIGIQLLTAPLMKRFANAVARMIR